MKPTLRLHRGFVAATLGLTLSLTLAVVFSGSILLAQTFPPPNASVRDTAIPPVTPQTATQPAPQTAPPHIRQLASQKLHEARKAVATKDIATAERLLNEVAAMQLTYQENEDSPTRVQSLVQGYRQLAEHQRTQGNTEQFRREYARFNLMQADTMVMRGELELATQLTQEAAKMDVPFYSVEDRNRGLEPMAMVQKINDARRVQSMNAPAAAVPVPQHPLSGASQTNLEQALQLLQQARMTLDAGYIEQAEQFARRAAAYELPEYAFPQGNTPNRFLTEVAARRQGVSMPPAANPQLAVANPSQTPSQIVQAGASQTLAPQVPVPVPPGRPTAHVDETIQRQRMMEQQERQFSSDVMQKLSDAQRKTQVERRPDEALEILHNLKRSIEQSPQIDAARKEAFVQIVDRAIAETQSFQDRYRSLEAQNQINEAVWAELRQNQQQFQDREEQLAAMFKEHKKLVDEGRFEEALILAKKAREFAPDDPATELMATMARLVYNNDRSRSIQREKWDANVAAFIHVDETSIIPRFDQSDMHFHPDWATMKERRQATTRNFQYQRPAMEQRILRQLEMPITFNNNQPIPLEQALHLLCNMVDLNHFIDQAALREADVPTGQMVVIPNANGIKLKSVLNIILGQLGLAYVVKDEMLNITSQRQAKGDLTTKLYYVGDIADSDRSAVSANIMEEAFRRSFDHQDRRPPSGNMNLPLDAPMPGAPMPNGVPVTRNGMPVEGDPNVLAQNWGGGGGQWGGGGMGFGDIFSIITTVIEPESWDPQVSMNGMGMGEGMISMHPATQSLAIRQTEEVHSQIEDLLVQIRKMMDLQIAVEVRYITLSDQFYERMGTAFDMSFRNDNAIGRITQVENIFPDAEGNPTSTLTPRGNNVVVGLSAPRVFTATAEIPLMQDSFSITTPAFGGYNPVAGISTGFALLSNLETYFFIQAAQGDRRSSVMEAPKVMLQNGQPGMVNDTTQIPFVTSVTPVVADFAVSYQPIITMLNQGQVLHVQANVSNDRQNVRLTLNPTFTTLVRVETFRYFGEDDVSEETATTGSDDTATTSTDPRSASRTTRILRSGITIQQPIMATFSVSTTVSCPDGGTVLLGGMKRLSEARNEAGVPILNKIPYIQRLFSNVGIGRDTQSVMIMVTPRIIIQEEEENFIMGLNMP